MKGGYDRKLPIRPNRPLVVRRGSSLITPASHSRRCEGTANWVTFLASSHTNLLEQKLGCVAGGFGWFSRLARP